MQYTVIFKFVKKTKINFQYNFFDIFLIFAQNIDCGYNLCFGAKLRKHRYSPAYPIFFYILVGFKAVYIAWACFPDVN